MHTSSLRTCADICEFIITSITCLGFSALGFAGSVFVVDAVVLGILGLLGLLFEVELELELELELGLGFSSTTGFLYN